MRAPVTVYIYTRKIRYRMVWTRTDGRSDGRTDRQRDGQRERLEERGARGQAGRCANHGAVTVRFLVGEETIGERERGGRERERERERERVISCSLTVILRWFLESI